jgi:NADH-ubiquinone oxidoreductase chain 5
MYILILTIPLINTLLINLCSFLLGKEKSCFLAVLGLALTFSIAVYIFYEVAICGSTCTLPILTWMITENLTITWGLLFDTLTACMLIVVTSISMFVHLYSLDYMSEDPHLSRFMSYLTLFTFFMLVLVTADNFVQMFLGWEGVGLASYLLINFWFTRFNANQAAMKALIVNKIGDFGFIVAIVLIFYIFKTVDFQSLFILVPFFKNTFINFLGFNVNVISLISALLFIGCIGKSAQIGLHVWLPDAMEGPTPVSALIHAATMVTAGVFLLIRCSPILENSPTMLLVIATFGGLTAFFASTCGLMQNDMKRVIAYSTCSQLGYMVFSCGLSTYSVGLFHLMNHAFFKALLFMSAGVVIHALIGEQDMRKMGGLIWITPLSYSCMFIGSLALMGFPYLAGFYSKDVIIEVSYATFYVDSLFTFWLGSISAGLTAFYSLRLLYYSFLSSTNSFRSIYKVVHEGTLNLLIPLFCLTLASIFIGYLMKEMIIGIGTDLFQNSIQTLSTNVYFIEAEFIPWQVKIIPLIFSMTGATLSLIVYNFFSIEISIIKTNFMGWILMTFFTKKWYFDQIYNYYIVQNILSFGYNVSWKIMDKGLIEIFGPFGLIHLIKFLSIQTSSMQTGKLYHYSFSMLLGFLLILFVFMIWVKLIIFNTSLGILLVNILLVLIYLLNTSNFTQSYMSKLSNMVLNYNTIYKNIKN